MKTHLTYRVAVSGDEAGILKVFAEVAPEVPTAVRSGIGDLIKRLVGSGFTLVAIDAKGRIIGYALAELHDRETLSLAYLGVSKVARDQHVSTSLVSKLQEIGMPIVTDVRSDNKSSMVGRFEHFGFVKAAPDAFSAERTKLRWEKQATPEGDAPARAAV